MAGPFAFFRKNQRVWMAILVIVSIISFVVLPNVDNLFQPNGGPANRNTQTLVSWKGGQINADRLEKLRMVHAQTYRIFSQMANEVIQAGGTPNVPGFSMSPQGIEIGIEQPINTQSVLQVRLFAEAARKRGIIVDDKTVDQFIQNFSDKKISAKRFDEIIREVSGQALSKFDMYEFLRDEIAKQILVQLGYSGLAFSQESLVSPSKNWMNYQKFQQRAKIEAYPVFVDQFLEKVTIKPSDQELRTLYNKAKDLLPQPNSPEPGFRRPYQANVEFLLADLNVFLKDEEAKLGDDVLKATYEKRVADEGAYKVPVDEVKPSEPAAVEKAAEKASEPTLDGLKLEDLKPTEPPTSSPTESKATELKSDEPVSASPSSSSEAGTGPSDATPEPAKQPAPPELSSSQPAERMSLRLVAFQNEPTDKPSVETPPDTPTTVPTEPVAPAPTEPKAEVATDAEATKAAESSPAAAQDAKPLDTPPAGTKEAEKPMRVKSFDEVREELRRELALKPAQDKMQASIAAAQEIMDQYYNQLQLFKTADPNNPDTLEPSLPALPKLADQFDLTYGKTGMVNSISVDSLPIGRSFTQFGAGQFDMFARSVFNNRLRLYQAATSQGFSGGTSQTFLFWKIEEANTRVPPFEEVRDEVVKAWQLAEARKLATKAAEELAGSINATTEADPWPQVLEPSLQPLVLKPPMFTWLQPMLTGNEGIQLSMVEGIDQPGQAFMERAFATPIGKASIALDASQQKCFVIRVVERVPNDQQLLADFEKAPLNRGVVSLAMQQTSISASRWFDSLVEEMDIDMSNLAASEASMEE